MESNQATELNEVILLALEVTARKHKNFAHPAIIQKGTGLMIDGYHRTAVVNKLAAEGIEVALDVKEIETDDPKGMAIEINSKRRSWNDAEERRTQVQFLASQTDEGGNSFSNQQMADALGASKETIRRDLSKVATDPNVSVAKGTTVLPRKAGTKPSATKGKDGKVRAANKASKEVITKAWAMKDSGMSASAIAKDLGANRRTVSGWFLKERPEAVAPAPAPTPAIVAVAAPPIQTDRKGLFGITERIINRERKEIKRRTELLVLLVELNKIMGSSRKFAHKELKDHGCAILCKYMGEANEIMVADGVFSSACVVLGISPEASYEEMLRGIEAQAMQLSSSARGMIHLYSFTGPVPILSSRDEMRYKQHPEESANKALAGSHA